jgi:hypothetical protein
VWTSGRFENMLDEKDSLVCVHSRNIPWAWGCFWYVKVPSPPYKRGREGTCKRIQTFGNLCNLQRESQSLCALTLCLNVLRTLSLSHVRGIIRIFRVTPQQLATGGARVSLVASRGSPDSLHQRLWPFIPTRGFLGTVWWLSLRGQPTVCLGLPCKVWINRFSASHRYLRLLTPLAMRSHMMEVDEFYAWLTVWYNLVYIRWLI